PDVVARDLAEVESPAELVGPLGRVPVLGRNRIPRLETVARADLAVVAMALRPRHQIVDRAGVNDVRAHGLRLQSWVSGCGASRGSGRSTRRTRRRLGAVVRAARGTRGWPPAPRACPARRSAAPTARCRPRPRR